jgi:hypothetical protein
MALLLGSGRAGRWASPREDKGASLPSRGKKKKQLRPLRKTSLWAAVRRGLGVYMESPRGHSAALWVPVVSGVSGALVHRAYEGQEQTARHTDGAQTHLGLVLPSELLCFTCTEG